MTRTPPAGCPATPSAPQRILRLLAVLVMVLLGVTGCSPSAITEVDVTEAAVDGALVPAIPPVAEQSPAAPSGGAEEVEPPTPRPRAGTHVLVDLEGPVTNRDAADVVLRTERGVQIDRFRLPGAVDVVGEPGGRWALISTLAGQWARLDGVAASLSLLSFGGTPPVSEPVLDGPVAYWNDPDSSWVLRLDLGTPLDLRTVIDEPVQIVHATADGNHLLARGAQTYIVSTADGSVRTLDQNVFTAMSRDGTLAVVRPRDGGGALLTVEAADGSGRRELALLTELGEPVPLPDGRVLVAGPTSALVDADGGQSQLPALVGVRGLPTVSPDGRIVVLMTNDGVTVVDTAEATVTPIADTVGYSQPVGDGRWAWSTSEDPDRAGALVIDTQTGQVTPLLGEVPTGPVASVTDDGALAAVVTGPGGREAVIISADGLAMASPDGAIVADVALHPAGTHSASAVIVDTTRSVVIRRGADQLAQIDTGRSPLWLRTTG